MGTNFYAIYNKCEHCGRSDEMHLGKQSAGWRFTFQSIERYDLKLTTARGWFAFLQQPGTFIEDEYGNKYTFDEFKKRVRFFDGRSTAEWNGLHYTGCTREQWTEWGKHDYKDDEGYDFCRVDFS